MLFPDRPGLRTRRKKYSRDFLTRNDNGLHFNGPILLAPKSRFRQDPIEHIEANQSKYCRYGIERIHVKAVDYIPGIADYSGKTVKWRRANPDDILILPLDASELPQKISASIPEERAIKDIQSTLHVSDEVAEAVYASRRGQGIEALHR
jgi:hypothetical protein